MKPSLSVRDTEVLKGVALLMLLCHHCLESGKPYQDLYVHGKGLVLTLSVFCKLCVSVFVFLSGYGLTLSANKQGGIGSVFRFYRRRYVKLMMNYWFIYLLFVPFGVFVMGRTFPDVYGGHVVGKAVLDFFGLYYAVTGDCFGYNATWWFYGCIILLYAAFPLLYRCRKYWYVWVVVAQMPVFSRCNNYILAFSLGMIMAEYGFTPPHSLSRRRLSRLACGVVFMAVCVYRQYSPQPILWESAIVFLGCYFYLAFPLPSWLNRWLSFVGRHSFNIFLFHTFVYAYYFSGMIYWSSNPLLIYLTLLLVCLAVSAGIEQLKRLLRIDRLQHILTQ